MTANNEFGAQQPVQDIGALCKEKKSSYLFAKRFSDNFSETIRRLSQSFTSGMRNSCNTLYNLPKFSSQSKPIFQFQSISEQSTQTYLRHLKQANQLVGQYASQTHERFRRYYSRTINKNS